VALLRPCHQLLHAMDGRCLPNLANLDTFILSLRGMKPDRIRFECRGVIAGESSVIEELVAVPRIERGTRGL
jgi:hypothetical protein